MFIFCEEAKKRKRAEKIRRVLNIDYFTHIFKNKLIYNPSWKKYGPLHYKGK